LQYFAKANIAPDSTFQKEIKDIKQTAEQALVNALTRFHKRRFDSLRNKLETRPIRVAFNQSLGTEIKERCPCW